MSTASRYSEGMAQSVPGRTVPLLVFVGVFLFITGCATTSAQFTVDTASIQNPAIDESSALVESRQFSGVFWTLNDSGGANVLFAIDSQGQSIATVPVPGATNVDWESLALDDLGNLYVGLPDDRSTVYSVTL